MRTPTYSVLVLVVLSTFYATGQQRNQTTMRELTRPAGVIFVGRVKSVQYLPAGNSTHVATFRIRFQVEQGLRGARSGRVLTIRQWAGLWDQGERFRPGERLLLFLYPSSKLGLSSPVGGARGRFALDRGGQVLLGMERAALFNDGSHVTRNRVPLKEFVSRLRQEEE